MSPVAPSRSRRAGRFCGVLAGLALLAGACGSSPENEATPDATGANPDAAATAAANIDNLRPSDDVRTLEVLDVTTGEPTTIAAAVTGDRPVLLWFWAPH